MYSSIVYCIVHSSVLLPLRVLLSLAGPSDVGGGAVPGTRALGFHSSPTAVSLRENKPDSSGVSPSPWLPMAQGNRGRVGEKVMDGSLGHLLYFLTSYLCIFYLIKCIGVTLILRVI